LIARRPAQVRTPPLLLAWEYLAVHELNLHRAAGSARAPLFRVKKRLRSICLRVSGAVAPSAPSSKSQGRSLPLLLSCLVSDLSRTEVSSSSQPTGSSLSTRKSNKKPLRKWTSGCITQATEIGWTACACRKSNPDILVVQPADNWAAKNMSGHL
jgi:hypothetical protein